MLIFCREILREFCLSSDNDNLYMATTGTLHLQYHVAPPNEFESLSQTKAH